MNENENEDQNPEAEEAMSVPEPGSDPDAEVQPLSDADSPPGDVPPTGGDNTDLSVLDTVTAERDQYLDALQRSQAEFANFRKAVTKRESDARARAAESLVAEMLPVLDACDAALAQGVVDVEPVHKALLDVLERAGLTRVDPLPGELFDPNAHEAVMNEPGDGGEPEVAEVLRAGFAFKLRVLRPAMVKVRS